MSTEQSGSPPFCFLIPLQSEQVSANWNRVSKLFELCLTSIFDQTSGNFLVLVGCHEIPEIRFLNDPRLRFISVDSPPPGKTSSPQDRMVDKYDKLAAVMVEAGKLDLSHIMFVDADDLVSRRLVEFAQQHPDSNGWIFRHGYRYAMGSRFILEQRGNFDCGTNSIINASKLYFPRDLSQEERLKCVRLKAGHNIIAEAMEQQGTPFELLPFPGSVYTVNHGDNWTNSGKTTGWRQLISRSHWKFVRMLSRGGKWHRLSSRIREEFAMPARDELIRICQPGSNHEG